MQIKFFDEKIVENNLSSYNLYKKKIENNENDSLGSTGDRVMVGYESRICETADLGNDVKIGDNVAVGSNVKIGNGVVIGNNVVIEDDVNIEDGVIIKDDVEIGYGSTIRSRCLLNRFTTVGFESVVGLESTTEETNVVVDEWGIVLPRSKIDGDVNSTQVIMSDSYYREIYSLFLTHFLAGAYQHTWGTMNNRLNLLTLIVSWDGNYMGENNFDKIEEFNDGYLKVRKDPLPGITGPNFYFDDDGNLHFHHTTGSGRTSWDIGIDSIVFETNRPTGNVICIKTRLAIDEINLNVDSHCCEWRHYDDAIDNLRMLKNFIQNPNVNSIDDNISVLTLARNNSQCHKVFSQLKRIFDHNGVNPIIKVNELWASVVINGNKVFDYPLSVIDSELLSKVTVVPFPEAFLPDSYWLESIKIFLKQDRAISIYNRVNNVRSRITRLLEMSETEDDVVISPKEKEALGVTLSGLSHPNYFTHARVSIGLLKKYNRALTE